MLVEILSLLFEILSVVICIHYLYGEKLRLDIFTVGFVIIEMTYLWCINMFAMDNWLTVLMYPMVMVYCGIRFGFNIKTLIVNNILHMVIVSTIQATVAIIIQLSSLNSSYKNILS